MKNSDSQSGKPNITPWSLVHRRRKVKGRGPLYREPDAEEYAEAERRMKEMRDGDLPSV